MKNVELTPMDKEWGIHWFRRDLRLPNNHALSANIAKTGGRTVGLFCFDSKFLSRPDFSHRRFAFFIETIKALRSEMRRFGGDLLVIDSQPIDAFAKLIGAADAEGLPKPLVTFNRDYEPFARARDEAVEKRLVELGALPETKRDHLIFEPQEILKKDGSPYQKYSAFAVEWTRHLHSALGQKRIDSYQRSQSYFEKQIDAKPKSDVVFKVHWRDLIENLGSLFTDQLQHFESQNRSNFKKEIPPAGFNVAYAAVQSFKGKLSTYEATRGLPAIHGSSELSKFLKNGSLTLAHIIFALKLSKTSITIGEGEISGEAKFLKELIWREYYYYILYHYPRVEKEAFQKRFGHVAWSKSSVHFEKWKNGETGVPIVDAGMRELNETGWINNRVRIIVASYLIKDLEIDWKLGEEYFMNQLIDGDLAANNGNWQWVASTGSEAQPYFRVMNPWRQGERFDKDGAYIRKWVPELNACSARDLHTEKANRSKYGYPPPLVDHDDAKNRSIDAYARTKSSSAPT